MVLLIAGMTCAACTTAGGAGAGVAKLPRPHVQREVVVVPVKQARAVLVG